MGTLVLAIPARQMGSGQTKSSVHRASGQSPTLDCARPDRFSPSEGKRLEASRIRGAAHRHDRPPLPSAGGKARTLLVTAKVAARESAIVALAGIAYWNVRRNPTADQPAKDRSTPTRRIPPCCACAVSGHATAAPPMSVMNSRRIKRSNCLRSCQTEPDCKIQN